MSHPSPRQNRVDPWSHLVAAPARGQLMGNRGCLHNDKGSIQRTYQVTRWIICVLAFRGRKRAIMQPGHYTELFFLDEATALAAGHRPCAECQRSRYQLFLGYWGKTQPGVGPIRANDVDSALHAARWDDGRRVTYTTQLGDLPAGVIIAALEEDVPYLVWQGQLWRWDFTGYTTGPQWPTATQVRVLTPRPIVEILAAGYPVQVHPSLSHRIPLESGIPS